MTVAARWTALAIAHTVGLIGAIVLAFHTFTYDTAPIVVLAAVGLSALGVAAAFVAAARQLPEAWLVVAGVWIYDATIAGLREPSAGRQWGYALLFAGYGAGAVASFLSRVR
ncbi:MAG: hypothetical protein J2P16_00295 [Mycobacterium sp.]|nr:hypothetical protein [Mycobacterium sp.]